MPISPKLVVDYAEKSDPVALKLMEQCGSDASAILRALAWRGVNKIALMGGFAEYVEPWLEADVAALLVPRKHDARDGAILLAGGALLPFDPDCRARHGTQGTVWLWLSLCN